MRRAVASQKIVGSTTIGPGANEWYGTLVNTNIRYEDGSAVTCNSFLGVKFIAPNSTSEITLNALLSPWQAVTPSIVTQPIDAKTMSVTAKVILDSSHTFNSADTLTWGINGNLTDNPDLYTGSFEFYADSLPSGTVEVTVEDAPDSALADSTQVVYLDQDGGVSTPFSLSPGETKSFDDVAAGDYSVRADNLSNSDGTVVAAAEVSPTKVTVAVGEKTTIKVSYGDVSEYSGLDVCIGSLSAPIDKEKLSVTVVDTESGKTLAEFLGTNNSKTELRQLPSKADIQVKAEATVNNVKYSASKTASLSNNIVQVAIDQDDFQTEDIDTSGFVELPVVVSSDDDVTNGTISVRLTSADSVYVYTQDVHLSDSSAKFDALIAPGSYTVQATGFIDDSVVYGVKAPASLSVDKDGSTKLELTVKRGANLKVHGFPDFLSFGALTDLVDLEGSAFVSARASSAFKYAGNDGAGDPGRYLDDDPATTKTIELAASAEEAIGGGHTVLPVMISYTVNLSLGATEDQLQNAEQLAHSFGNLILSLNLAKQSGKSEVPAGYVVNPDFLGECQKGPDGKGFSPDYKMPVREPLQEALDYRKVEVEIPSSIDDTLKGYVAAVNWLFRTVAEKVTFGWQVNLWGVGNSEWIYSKDSSAEGPVEMAKKTADYIKSLNVYTGDNKPDFLAIDRYEADDFTQRGYANGYCYGPYEWGRFFDFCSNLSLETQVAVMPWQIPASRIPNKDESVVNLETEHWGSGGTYIFGDPAIGSDYNNIHPTILAIKPSSIVPYSSVKDIFVSAQPFDLSNPTYGDFPLRGIFTVLLGGGATTGIITTVGKTGPWTQAKINEYMDNPIPLDQSY